MYRCLCTHIIQIYCTVRMCYCYFYDEVIYVCLYVRMFIFDSNVQSLFCFVYPISDPMLSFICYLIRCIYLCNHFTDTAFCIHSPALSLSLSSYYITWYTYTYTYTTYTPNTNQTSKSNHITSNQKKGTRRSTSMRRRNETTNQSRRRRKRH